MQTADPSKSEISINGQRRYVCCICGRISLHKTKSHGNIYCAKHYKQIKKYGHPTDSNPRTIYDRNEIRIDGDVAYVDLYDNKCNVIAAAIIDAEDVPLIRYTKWKLSNSGYAMNTPKFSASNTHMSRVILGVDCIADHINYNTLDNRKANLRPATKAQNAMNHKAKGVRETDDGRYYAYIKRNQRMFNLGVYTYQEEAEYARWYAERILFGDYAYPREMPIIPEKRTASIKQYVDRKVQRL